MNILYIVPYVPSLIRVRSYNLIRTLAAKGHRVTVVAIGSSDEEKEDADLLKHFCHEVWYFEQPKWISIWNSVSALPTSRPLQSVYSWRHGTAERINHLISSREDGEKFDIIHVEHLRGSRFGTYLKSHQPHIPIVLDSVDCISYLFEQASDHSQSLSGKLLTRLELNRTRTYEAQIPHLFDHVLVTSKVDLEALERLRPPRVTSAPMSILPNGVDIDYFSPNQSIVKEDYTVVFSGKMSYHANITMALFLVEKIMPHIWKVHPETRLYIVGKDPSADIRALSKHPSIEVTGTVNDIRPYLWKATVAVVPLVYGAGSQLKLLEAMASGLPVVATPRAALPLAALTGKDILVEEKPEDFAGAVVELLTCHEKRDSVALSGFNYVQKNHNWWNIGDKLENIYTETITHPLRSS